MEQQVAPPPAKRRLRDRSTGDLLVLMIAGTICFSVMAGGATVAIVALVSPSTDTTVALRAITGIVNTLVGLLAGFLAGKTGAALEQQSKGPPS